MLWRQRLGAVCLAALWVAGCASGGGDEDDAGSQPIGADASIRLDSGAAVDAARDCSACPPLERCVAGACAPYPACTGAGMCEGDAVCRSRRCLPPNADTDRDGSPASVDCNEADPAINPNAAERCDQADQDCDDRVDEAATDATSWYVDADGDGYGTSDVVQACEQPAGRSAMTGDCNDGNPSAFPGATERCDNVDGDCDGRVDESAVDAQTWYLDADGDTYGLGSDALVACTRPAGRVAASGDCDDTNGGIRPGVGELCDNIDADCDGRIDESASNAGTYYRDADGDGYGNAAAPVVACAPPGGFVGNGGDCNDGANWVNPGAGEICNGADENCRAGIDDGACQPGCTGRSWSGHAYMFCGTRRSWFEARDDCAARGFRLVRIDSAAENNWVRGQQSGDQWIGANDLEAERRWVWPDGAYFWQGDANGSARNELFTRWDRGEPNDDDGEDCAEQQSDGEWNDIDCDDSGNRNAYVCELY